jgi:hypothetical protein
VRPDIWETEAKKREEMMDLNRRVEDIIHTVNEASVTTIQHKYPATLNPFLAVSKLDSMVAWVSWLELVTVSFASC